MEKEGVEALRQGLEQAIRGLPEGFYDTFNFVTTGMTLCHPITVGLIAKVVGEMERIAYVGVDVRLNNGKGQKFQPDVVGFADAKSVHSNQPAILVDFESPNSCDGRIPQYHLRQYCEWVRDRNPKVPYVIVTSLPDTGAAKWELWYKSEEYNSPHRGKMDEIRANPFRYWTSVWRNKLGQRSDLSDVFFFNIDRRNVVSFQVLQPK